MSLTEREPVVVIVTAVVAAVNAILAVVFLVLGSVGADVVAAVYTAVNLSGAAVAAVITRGRVAPADGDV